MLLSSPPRSLVKATRRLNPAIDVEVDVLAVVRAAGASTKEDWTAGTFASTAADDRGAVRLAETGSPQSLFGTGGSTAGATDKYSVHNPSHNTKVTETLWLDFWPDPAVVGPNGFTLHSVDLVLGRKDGSSVFGSTFFGVTSGKLILNLTRFDENWNREVIADRMEIPAALLPLNPGLATINFRDGTINGQAVDGGRLVVVRTGRMRTRTGSGRTSTGAERTADFANEGDKKVSHLSVPYGFSIGITAEGFGLDGMTVGMFPTATLPAFDTSTFWRTTSDGLNNRDLGPYSPDADGISPLQPNDNPGYGFLESGAVPGFGAKNTAITNGGGTPLGVWGLARMVNGKSLPQTIEEPGWQQPYHTVKAVTYPASGTVVRTLNLGAVPTNEVHFRVDTAEPTGTSVAFKVERSPDNATWTTIGTSVLDGTVFTGADLAQYYRVTATLTASPDGLATPSVNAVFLTERVRYATWKYMKDLDSSVSVDPVTGQSEIGELALPLLKLGRNDARDIVTRMTTEYAPSSIEAWVYVRETLTGTRHFLNLYRLEDRDPSLGEERLTFVSGMDRLKVIVPQKQESAQYPTDGSLATITAVSYNSTTKVATITVAGTPFAATNIIGWRYEGVSGTLAGSDWSVVSVPAPTASTFAIVLEDDLQAPSIGDHFRLHSDITQRTEVVYGGMDFAAVYADILTNQAAVPSRYRGALPPTTGRTTDNRLTSDGRAALDPLQEVALHAGGAITWRKGRIDYVDLYGPRTPVATWSEKDYTDAFKPTVGAARRMPSIAVKYGYDFTADKFGHEVTFDDLNALIGWGRANLFDVSTLSDDLCKWNDYNEGKHLALKLLRAWSTGVRIWKVPMVHPWPWIEVGDAVTVSTDIYTDRRLSFSADGLTDNGEPVKGRTTAVARVIGKNLLGTEFLVAVFGLDSISESSGTDGTIDTTGGLACPAIALSTTVRGSFSLLRETTLVVTFTPPDNPYYARMEFGVTTDTSGDSAANEVSATESPVRIRAVPGVTYTVTPYVVSTAGDRTAGTPQSIFIPSSYRIGGIPRSLPNGKDDGEVGSTRGQSRAGAATAARTDEDAARGGLGGVPVKVAQFMTAGQYTRDGASPLIDPDLARLTTNLSGPTGAWNMTTIERGGGKGDASLDSGNVLVAASADFSRAYTGKHLGNMPDDATSDRRAATANEKTGGGRGFSALDSGNVVVSGSMDFSRSYTNKHLGNLPDDATSDRRAATANEKTGGSRGFSAIDSGLVLVTSAIDLARSYVNKHLGNIPDDATSDRKAVDTNRYTGAFRGYNALDSSNKLATGVTAAATAADGKVGIESGYGAKVKSARQAGIGAQGIVHEGRTRAGLGGVPVRGSQFFTEPVYDITGAQVIIDPSDTGALSANRTLGTRKARAQMYPGAAQTIGNNSLTTVGFDSTTYDTDSIVDLSGDTLVIPADHLGLWVIHVWVTWASNATGYRFLQISSGSAGALTYRCCAPANGKETTHDVWLMVNDPNAGETFFARVQQTSGGNLNLVNGGVGNCGMEIVHIW